MNPRIRVASRGVAVLGRIGIFLGVGAAHELALASKRLSHPERQRRRARLCSRHALALLEFLGFEIRFESPEHLEGSEKGTESGMLIVANHLSFWDTLVLSSRFPCLYVTSVEIRDTPLLGWIARLGGCVFVERRDRSGIDREIATLVAELKAGQRVVLFPEGTSSDGSGVLPFKRSLFKAAVEARVPIVPVCLNYRKINGRPLDSTTRDFLFYYGDQRFFQQLGRVFGMRSVEIDVDVLEPFSPGPAPDPGLAHHRASETARERIISRYSPIETGELQR